MKFLKITAITLSLLASASIAAAQSTPLPRSSPIENKQSTSIPTLDMDGAYAEIDGDHVLGSPTAPISMIIYASVTCPHCASWFNSVWPDIKRNYVETNKLRVVIREFPTAPANIAVIGFQIANCGPENQYFDMIEHQMKEQDNIFISLKAGTGKATYLEIAKKAGLVDEAAMNTCLENQSGIERINKSMTLAKAAEINSVPSFIINGQVWKQGSNYLPLSKHLNEVLAQGYSPMLKP